MTLLIHVNKGPTAKRRRGGYYNTLPGNLPIMGPLRNEQQQLPEIIRVLDTVVLHRLNAHIAIPTPAWRQNETF